MINDKKIKEAARDYFYKNSSFGVCETLLKVLTGLSIST